MEQVYKDISTTESMSLHWKVETFSSFVRNGCGSKPHLPLRESYHLAQVGIYYRCLLYALYERSHLAINSIIKTMRYLLLFAQV